MFEISFKSYLCFNVIVFSNWFITYSNAKCPCLPASDFMCGWEINMQFQSNCTEHYIYEPCEEKESNPVDKCPNECFYSKEKNDKIKVQCGICMNWDSQNCVKPGKLSKTKLQFDKKHQQRPLNKRMKAVPESSSTAKKFGNINCDRNKTHTTLEFVLIQDASGSYVLDHHSSPGGSNSYLESLKKHLPEMLKNLTNEFPWAKFGVTYFVDYKGTIPRTKHDKCYDFIQSLTDKQDTFVKAVNKIPVNQNGGDAEETSLTGLLYTAAEKKMNWSKEKYREDGKRVIKVLAVTTDALWKSSSTHISKGSPPKGDGYDTCSNSLPSEELVKKVLLDEDFYIIGLIGENYHTNWLEYMTTLGMEDRSVIEDFNLDYGAGSVTQKLLIALREILCLPSVETTTTTTTEETTTTTTEEPSEEATTEDEPSEKVTTEKPSEEATEEPSEEATEEPSEEATEEPSEEATEEPSEEATEEPSEEATTGEPSEEATTGEPSEEATTEEHSEEATTEYPSEEATSSEEPVEPSEKSKAKKYEMWMWQLIAI